MQCRDVHVFFPYVRVCILYTSTENEGDVTEHYSEREKKARIFASLQAVSKMHLLESLTLHGGLSNWSILLQGVRFQLKSFCAYCTPEGGMAMFLDKQRRIEWLSIYSGNPNNQGGCASSYISPSAQFLGHSYSRYPP